jgi:predicted outer membrane repeat protein
MFNLNSSPILTDVIFRNNSATVGAGGGMNNQTSADTDPSINPVLKNVTFSGNSAPSGGGLFNGNSNTVMTNVTFSGNTASIRGGGMYNEGANPTLTNITFNGNSAPVGFGGAIRNNSNSLVASNAVIKNSILWGDGSEEITSDGTGTSTISDSVVQGGFAGGTNIITTDPNLAALANNGGFTQTMALGAGSSAIDAANNPTCATTDQRGLTRPQGAACDMGAFEFGGTTTTITAGNASAIYGSTSVNLTATVSPNPGGGTVQFYIDGNSVGSPVIVNVGDGTATFDFYPSTLNAGAHTIRADFSGSGNFLSSSSNPANNGTLTINKATLTVTADDRAINYGDADPTFTVTYTGFVAGDTAAVIDTPPTCTVAGVHTNVGTYTITCSGGFDNNYNYNTYIDGTLTVNKATPTLSVTNSPIPYDGSPHEATVTGSALGTVSNVLTGGSVSKINAGTYEVTADFTPTDTANYNSLVGASAGDFTISKANPTLSVTNSPILYDGSPHSATVTGSVFGTVSNILTGGSVSQTNAGTYAVTADFIPTDTANYNSLTDALAGDFIINKITPTLSVTNSPVTYDGLPHSATVTGSVPGTASNILTGGSVVKTDVGTYAVTADFTPDDATNYNSLSGAPAGNFIINKATPTLFVTNSPITYNGSPHAATVAGSVSGTVSNILTGGSASQINAGTYAITADFTPSDTANYNSLTDASAGNFIINKATPALSVMNSPVLYNGVPRAATVVSSVPGTISNVLTGGSASQTNAGTYSVTADFIPTDNANYNSLTNAPAGNFVINKITPTLSVTNSPVLFNGSPQAATVTGSVPGTISNVLTGGSATQINVGTYAVTADFAPTDTANYNSLTAASAGNFVISTDITPPDTQLIIRPASPSSADVTFTFSSADATATFECQLDGSGFSACTSPKDYISLASGTHTFDVRAKDPSNNIDATPASYTWIVTVNTAKYIGSKIVVPSSLATQGGSTNGSISSLGFFEQGELDDDAGTYINFQTPGSVYVGYQSFFLPNDVQPALISTMLLQINYKGPAASTQTWTWSIYDWSSGQWIKLGDNIGANADQWQVLTFSIRSVWRYISRGKEIRIQLRSNNANGDARIDYEALHLTYRPVIITPAPVAPPVPASRPGIASGP